MAAAKKKSMMRNLGEFIGHIVKGAKTQVNEEGDEVVREEVSRTVEEEERGGVTLRRTTIEEVEFKKGTKARRHEGTEESGGQDPTDNPAPG